MKKAILNLSLLCLLSSVSLAEPLQNVILTSMASETIEQQEIKSISDYNELEKLLKRVIFLGKEEGAIALAALYMRSFSFDDGTSIKEKPELAKAYLQDAINDGYGFAAFNLIKFTSKTNALNILYNSFYLEHTKERERETLAIRYSEIILNNKEFYENKNTLSIAIERLLPIFENSNNLILGFMMAHLYYANGIIDKANKLLNFACNNKNTSKRLWNMCMTDINLDRKRSDGKKILPTKTVSATSCYDKNYNGSK